MWLPMRAFLEAAGLLWLVAAAFACGQDGAEDQRDERPVQEKTIEEALREHTDSLMSLPGVVGTGQGLCDGQPCIKVFIVKKTPELLSQIPAEIEGYTVAVEETGEIKALEP